MLYGAILAADVISQSLTVSQQQSVSGDAFLGMSFAPHQPNLHPTRSAVRWPAGLARGLWGNRPQGRDRSGQSPETQDLQLPPGSNTLMSRCFLSRNVSAWSTSLLAPGRKIIANSWCWVVAKPWGIETEERAVWATRCVAKAWRRDTEGRAGSKRLCWGQIGSRRSWLHKLEKR